MTRSFAVLAATILFTTTALAGPMAMDKRVASAKAPAQRYVVSATLNKLVFWHVPDRDDSKTPR